MTDWWVQLVAVLASFATPGDQDPMCSVLGGLDLARTQAVVGADVHGLEQVYASPALFTADQRLIASYSARGLRLHGAVLQRHACRRLAGDQEHARLAVVDSVGPTWITTRSGERRSLPRDRPTRRVVELRLTGAGWRVVSVR